MSLVQSVYREEMAPSDAIPMVDYPAPFHALGTLLEQGEREMRFAKTLDAESEIFAGHYPHFPIFPGVLIYEAFSQAVQYYAKKNNLPITGVSRIKSLRFLKSLYPGDSYRIIVKQVGDDGNGNIDFQLQCESGNVTAALAVLVASHGFAAPSEPADENALSADSNSMVHPAAILPQRYPMLLVDRMLTLQSGTSVLAQKNVSISEPCYRYCTQVTHVEQLAYPVSLVIESFAQTVGLLLDSVWDMTSAKNTHVVVFGGFQDIVMHGSAYPGDAIVHSARVEHANASSSMFCGHSSVNGKRIMSYKRLIGLMVPRQQLQVGA